MNLFNSRKWDCSQHSFLQLSPGLELYSASIGSETYWRSMNFDLEWLCLSQPACISKSRDAPLGANAQWQRQDLRSWGRRKKWKTTELTPQDTVTNNDVWNDWQSGLKVFMEKSRIWWNFLWIVRSSFLIWAQRCLFWREKNVGGQHLSPVLKS